MYNFNAQYILRKPPHCGGIIRILETHEMEDASASSGLLVREALLLVFMIHDTLSDSKMK